MSLSAPPGKEAGARAEEVSPGVLASPASDFRLISRTHMKKSGTVNCSEL